MRKQLSRFPLLLSIFLSLCLPCSLLANKTVLNFVSFGGAYQNSQIQAMQKPYSKKTGITFNNINYSGGIAKLRVQAENRQHAWDVIDMFPGDMLRAREEGLLAPMDIVKFPAGIVKNEARTIPPLEDFEGLSALNGTYYAVPNISVSTYIAFNKTKYSDPNHRPNTLKDFFDLKHFPGKRGIRKATPEYILEMALYADGVPTTKIYDVLATQQGQDRAFKKLAQLKGHIIWWTAGSQPQQLLADHEVVMTEAWNGRISAAMLEDKIPFGEIWDGHVFDVEYFAIPKGNPKYKQAIAFLKFATGSRPLADASNYIAYGPLRKSSQTWVSDKMRPYLPTSHLKQAIIFKPQFWLEHRDSIQKRWENFVGHS